MCGQCAIEENFGSTSKAFLYAYSFQNNQSAFANAKALRQHKATTTTGKATTAAADPTSQSAPRSGLTKPLGRKLGSEDARARSTARPDAPLDRSPGPEKGIDDIKDLSLDYARSKQEKDHPTLINNPRKRGAEGESERHGKTLLGGRDADLVRQGALPNDGDYRRDTLGPKQPLWDPHTQSSKPSQGVRREQQPGHNHSNRRRAPRERHSPTHGPGLAEKDNMFSQVHVSYERPQVQQILSDSGKQGKQSHPLERNREDNSSESPPEDEFPGNEPAEGPGNDPEMLLQPETRPISPEQLVVEVKGIYAGLVMVEAKCIDIDERQSAAAQERDPSKRSELKNDQWQSLIALHKQVINNI